jgi:hypothetical protein
VRDHREELNRWPDVGRLLAEYLRAWQTDMAPSLATNRRTNFKTERRSVRHAWREMLRTHSGRNFGFIPPDYPSKTTGLEKIAFRSPGPIRKTSPSPKRAVCQDGEDLPGCDGGLPRVGVQVGRLMRQIKEAGVKEPS